MIALLLLNYDLCVLYIVLKSSNEQTHQWTVKGEMVHCCGI